jgi:hypothetical protein
LYTYREITDMIEERSMTDEEKLARRDEKLIIEALKEIRKERDAANTASE